MNKRTNIVRDAIIANFKRDDCEVVAVDFEGHYFAASDVVFLDENNETSVYRIIVIGHNQK